MVNMGRISMKTKFYSRWVMGIWMNTISPLETLMIAGVIFFFFNLMFAGGMVTSFSYEYCLNTYSRIPWVGGLMGNFCRMLRYA